MIFQKGESYWAVPCLTGAKKKIVTVIGVRKVPVETQVELSYDRGKHSWKKTVSTGAEIDLNGEKFRVVSLRALENGCEVKVENVKTKKQKVIR